MINQTNHQRQMFLLRYRDLVEHTLDRHREVVLTHGYTYWGWWKRPGEPPRLEVWESLSRAIETDGQVQIGLFDSGTGKAHLAQVTAVIPPQFDEFGELQFIPLESSERDKVPSYYRDSTEGRAWLKLSVIANNDFPLFEEWSYDEPPILPGFTLSQRRQFEGKRLSDAIELRAMDTTVWSIRQALADDRSGQVLTARPQLLSGNDATPIDCPGDWLLHITDSHFAETPNRDQHVWRLEAEDDTTRPSMVNALVSSLKKHERTVGAVLVSGDLTFLTSDAEFAHARKSLFRLLVRELKLTLEHLVVIPGNHDVAWSNQTTYASDAPVTNAPAVATAAYRKFYFDLFGYDSNADLSMSRRYVFSGGNLIDIVAVNSSSLEQGKDFLSGMGKVQESALLNATTTMDWSQPGTGLRILSLHHHVALTDDVEPYSGYPFGFGIAVDAPRILRLAAREGVHLILHGHKHRAFIWRSIAYELPDKTLEDQRSRSINIIGGGSVGSSDTDGKLNYFNLIRLSGDMLTVEMYRSSQGGAFERIGTWTSRLVSNEGNFSELGPWIKVKP
jgi:hypothetical protein